MDRGGRPRVDEPLSAVAGALGEEGEQLLVIDLLRLRHHLLAQMRGLEISTKRRSP